MWPTLPAKYFKTSACLPSGMTHSHHYVLCDVLQQVERPGQQGCQGGWGRKNRGKREKNRALPMYKSHASVCNPGKTPLGVYIDRTQGGGRPHICLQSRIWALLACFHVAVFTGPNVFHSGTVDLVVSSLSLCCNHTCTSVASSINIVISNRSQRAESCSGIGEMARKRCRFSTRGWSIPVRFEARCEAVSDRLCGACRLPLGQERAPDDKRKHARVRRLAVFSQWIYCFLF